MANTPRLRCRFPELAGDVVEALADPRSWVQRRAGDAPAKASALAVLQP